MNEQTAAEVIASLIERAVIILPPSVKRALAAALARETSELARFQLQAILDNIALAESKKIPVCQDTGVPLFYLHYGTKFDLHFDLLAALRQGVALATERVPLRPNVVDAITRVNSGNNTGDSMPYVHTKLVPGAEFVEVTVVPKGGGSENMSSLEMILPSEGLPGIRRFVARKVTEFMGRPCPPYILGLGIGGSSDIAVSLAKEATLRPVGSPNPREDVAALESELLDLVNSLKVGCMGLGGDTTALAVHIEQAAVHTALQPVAINIQCWAARQAALRLWRDGRVEDVEE